MKLTILGSSSAGNCYLLDNGKESLLVECGLSYKSVTKVRDFDARRVKGCIISHEHGDHVKGSVKVLEACIPCYMSAGTAKALGLEDNHLVTTIQPMKPYRLGGFTVQGFDVQHDAAEPLGYLIHHKEMGTTLFATDTYYLKYKFAGLSNILIECNYRHDILEDNVAAGVVSKAQYNRTIKSHMSLETCKEVLLANDLSAVNSIVLIHLSPTNSHAKDFQQSIKELTGKNVVIAEAGMTMDFGKSPF